MTRRTACPAAALMVWPALAADFDAARWQYRSRFQVTEPARATAVRLHGDVYARSRFDDLRVVRGAVEVPYILETRAGKVLERELAATTLDKTVGESSVRVTLDLGEKVQHSRIRIATGERNFKRAVRVETSGDNRTWSEARAAGAIFDVSEGDVRASVLHVDYPMSTRRYVRATIDGFTSVTAVTGAWVLLRQETAAEWEPIAAPAFQRASEGKASIYDLRLGKETFHERIRLTVATPAFHRRVDVSVHGDERYRWRHSGTIHRVPGEESLAIEYGERRDRDLRLRIHNGDDQPLDVTQIHLDARRRVIRLPPSPAGDYWIYYGNPTASSPRYDLAAVLAKQESAAESSVAAGAPEANPAYSPPPKPFSDRYPSLLNGALAVAVLGMGAITVRFLKRVRAG